MPQAQMKESRNMIEDFLKSLYTESSFVKQDSSSHINFIAETDFIKALNYTLLAGGKRIRPLLCLIFSELCALKSHTQFNPTQVLPCAAALEMIHTYSLIHDDLPAMDNDDLRRGRPTCHKAFDEATAILTGDALLTDAFHVFMRADFNAEHLLKAMNVLSLCAGSKGMIAGQVLDMAMEQSAEQAQNIHLLTEMNARKTGDLLLAACSIPALLYNVDKSFYNECKDFALHFGLAFQITDDILDIVGDTAVMGKPKGSDVEANKSTWVTLLGLEEAKQEASKHIALAQDLVHSWTSFSDISSYPIQALLNLLTTMIGRTK